MTLVSCKYTLIQCARTSRELDAVSAYLRVGSHGLVLEVVVRLKVHQSLGIEGVHLNQTKGGKGEEVNTLETDP